MIETADIAKVSDEDLEWLGGGDTLEARAQTLLGRGPSLICVTRGAEGAVAYSADRRVGVPAERAMVVDTVGARDTFNAGILAALSEQGALTKTGLRNLSEEAMRTGLAPTRRGGTSWAERDAEQQPSPQVSAPPRLLVARDAERDHSGVA